MRPPVLVAIALSSLLASGLSPSAGAGTRLRAEPKGAHVLQDAARIILGPGEILENASLVVRDGRIEQVAANVVPPADAVVIDCRGMTIWPGFVDAHVELSRLREADAPWPDSALSHANARVRPERRALELLQLDPKKVAELREIGFTTAAVVPDAGILRGRGVVIHLGEGSPSRWVIAEGSEQHVAFESGRRGEGGYPSSTMGATAVMRQALLDADWYRRAWDWASGHPQAPRPVFDASLEALGSLQPARGRPRPAGDRPAGGLVFEAEDVLDALRALEVGSEFGLDLRITGAGDLHRRLPELVAARVPVVLPVDHPEPPSAAGDTEWLEVPTSRLLDWKRAPDVPRWLHEAGLEVALSTHRLEKPDSFAAGVRRCLEGGLSEEAALAMVTTTPAKLLGLERRLGTIARGKDASFVLAHGGPFDEGTEVREVWVAGSRHVVSRVPEGSEGRWDVVLRLEGPESREGRQVEGLLHLKGSSGSFTPTGEDDPPRTSLKQVSLSPGGASFELPGRTVGLDDALSVELRTVDARIEGGSSDGRLRVQGTRRLGPEAQRKEKASESAEPAPPPPPMGGPIDDRRSWLIRGATAWTAAAEGVLEDVDLLVVDGRIEALGRGLAAPRGVAIVEAAGLHLTPGLIDAHSHAAIVGGVNEGTNSCTAEVRIGDVLNSETPHLYRQLAGGLTTANLLHGSANCMGGQSQVIKLRNGAPPAGLMFAEADKGIKFALGENVKQSNWGEKYTERFPQSRMGVERFMRAKFLEALDYRDAWRRWSSRRDRGSQLPPRRDLQLETLVEILEGERSVHCHSYRQDEILMLIRVAEELGFRVGTFQHVLEGYKVADEIAAHGAMASAFTDWWAYKFEVYDAIPQAPSLMAKRGVTVSVNSDSSELARRMHLEAAKVAKWGGLDAHEALKFVTIHPAAQLGVEALVGSLEPGKQADFVLWSGPPLSTGSRALTTWVDGLRYFDLEHDRRLREERAAEREALIASSLSASGDRSAGGSSPKSPAYLETEDEHCLGNTAAGDAHDLEGTLR